MAKQTKGIADPDRGWRIWHIDEIFDPEDDDSDGRYVPNKDDLVFSFSQGWFRVIEVDYYTGQSELRAVTMPSHLDEEETTLIGRGPDTSYRVYLDTQVLPYRLAVDARLHLYGSDVDKVKIIQGTNIDGGEVISRYYVKDQNLVGDHLPLESEIWENGAESTTIQTVKVGHCSKKLDDGDVVTLVAFDQQGFVVMTARMLVKNTSWMRDIERPTKYVTNIELESDYLSALDDRLVEIPINFPLDGLPLRGIVHYDDGSTKRLPIDGQKFALLGLNHFVASVLGYRQRATLIYYLSANEQAYDSLEGEHRHIAKSYTFKTTHVEGAYTVKLFTFPVWQNESDGYKLEHYLYTLNRDEAHRVTNDIEIAENSDEFGPTSYGTNQVLTFALDLNKVSQHYHRSYRHLQTVYLRLDSPGNMTGTTNWMIGWEHESYHFQSGRHKPYTAQKATTRDDYSLWSRTSEDRSPYRPDPSKREEDEFTGRNVFERRTDRTGGAFKPMSTDEDFDYGEEVAARARRVNYDQYELELDTGASNQTEWLDKLYYAVSPLYEPATESAPPEPTHFKLRVGNYEMIYSVDRWSETLKIPKQLQTGDTVWLFWRKYIGDTDLELAVTAMIVHRVDT